VKGAALVMIKLPVATLQSLAFMSSIVTVKPASEVIRTASLLVIQPAPSVTVKTYKPSSNPVIVPALAV
jgi:hypothetical protein